MVPMRDSKFVEATPEPNGGQAACLPAAPTGAKPSGPACPPGARSVQGAHHFIVAGSVGWTAAVAADVSRWRWAGGPASGHGLTSAATRPTPGASHGSQLRPDRADCLTLPASESRRRASPLTKHTQPVTKTLASRKPVSSPPRSCSLRASPRPPASSLIWKGKAAPVCFPGMKTVR